MIQDRFSGWGFLFVVWAVLQSSCGKEMIQFPSADTDAPPPVAEEESEEPEEAEEPEEESISSVPSCPTYSPAISSGNLEHDDLGEASGIAASHKNPGVFWTHNDSGGDPQAFAFSSSGEHLGIYTLSGLDAEDWEDMAIGPGPVDFESYLYMGDIGSAGNQPIMVYRFVEPTLSATGSPIISTITTYDAIELRYPAGDPDAEALMVNPSNGDIYIVTKTGGLSKVYLKRAPHVDGESALLEEVASIDFDPLPGNNQPTGADISPDGTLIVIRTYSHAFIWLKNAADSPEDAFINPPCQTLALTGEHQGEAIGFDADGISLISVTEGAHEPVRHYPAE